MLFQFGKGCFNILTQIHLSKSDAMSRYLSQTGGLTQREIPKSPNWILAVFATIDNKGNFSLFLCVIVKMTSMFTFTPPDDGRVLNHDKRQRCNWCSPPQFVSHLLPTSLRPKQRTRPCELVHPGSHLCIFVSPKAFWDCINANTVS